MNHVRVEAVAESATPDTDAPSSEHCCKAWAFNCALYARRLGSASVDSLSILSTISFVYTMPDEANWLKMGSPPAYDPSSRTALTDRPARIAMVAKHELGWHVTTVEAQLGDFVRPSRSCAV